MLRFIKKLFGFKNLPAVKRDVNLYRLLRMNRRMVSARK